VYNFPYTSLYFGLTWRCFISMSFPVSMSRTALSISSGNFRHAALAAMSLRLVMSLYVEIQARIASWVIV
jgi:hypothetical protein